MFKSIRWSLQLWHAGLLALVLAGFGTAAYYGLESARFQQIDADLTDSVRTLGTSSFVPQWPGPGPRGFGGPNDFGGPGRPDRPGGRGGPRPDGGPGGGFGGPGGGPGGPDVRRGGGPPVQLEVMLAPQVAARFTETNPRGLYYVVWNFDRTINKTSKSGATDVPNPAPTTATFDMSAPEPKLRQRGDTREAYMAGPYGSELLVGKSTLADVAELHRSAWVLAAIGGGVLLLGLAGGYALSTRAVRPIRMITTAAQQISATNLTRRISLAETESELGQLAAVLNDAFGRLDASFKQQVRFTADASHELRTPLSVIHTNAQLALSRDRSGEEYRKTLETCLRASTRMKHLVDSLLVLAKADVGRLTLERSDFDLCDIAQECISMVAPLAHEKNVTLEPDLQSAEINADASKIAQVITNLLTNAIRYNRDGGRVTVKVASAKEGVTLSVADTGIGIPAEAQPHLFERFYRVDEARSREQGGTGLGLAICKSIVEAHGGQIACSSELGAGTTFTVLLPCTFLRT